MTTKFQYTEDQRGRVDARWTFDDGVQVRATRRPDWSPHQSYARTQREFEAKPRVYVTANERFNVLEDLENRTRRPYNVWRPRVVEALDRLGVWGRLNWSQHAGCSMCPCSPGFVMTSGDVHWGWDFWVTLPGAPAVDEAKPARQIVSTV